MTNRLRKAAFAAALAFAAAATSAPARDVYIEPDAPIVATVLGDTIRLRDTGDATRAIVARLRERYASEQGIMPATAEVDAQAENLRLTLRKDAQRWRSSLEEIDRRLLQRSLKGPERKALEDERRVLATLLRAGPAGPAESTPLEDPRIVRFLAEGVVQQWKIDRALHRQYGGRIAVMSDGLQPLDAYRRFLEERRDRGDFQFLSLELERDFWKSFAPGPAQDFLAAGSREEAQAYAVPPWQPGKTGGGGRG